MMHQLLSNTLTWSLFVGGLFFGMLLFLELGHRWGRRRINEDSTARVGLGGIEAAVYSLFGLLIAFTFSGAATRFDERRMMIVDEANAIGTAYMRLDLLPDQNRTAMQELFRRYLTARLGAYEKLPNINAALAGIAEADKFQAQIWQGTISGCKETPCTMLLLPALNEAFDIANTRLLVTQVHPPTIIFVMLLLLGLACAFMGGFAMSEGKIRKLVYSFLFPLIIAFTVYIILDLEFPRLGFIRVNDLGLVRVLETMK